MNRAGLSRARGRGRQHFRALAGDRRRSCRPSVPARTLDAIPNAGRFDGTVGVFGGLEAVRALQAAGFQPRRSIDVLMFTSEEPTRFGLGCLGSRLMSGFARP